jgi:hypothetical protein
MLFRGLKSRALLCDAWRLTNLLASNQAAVANGRDARCICAANALQTTVLRATPAAHPVACVPAASADPAPPALPPPPLPPPPPPLLPPPGGASPVACRCRSCSSRFKRSRSSGGPVARLHGCVVRELVGVVPRCWLKPQACSWNALCCTPWPVGGFFPAAFVDPRSCLPCPTWVRNCVARRQATTRCRAQPAPLGIGRPDWSRLSGRSWCMHAT